MYRVYKILLSGTEKELESILTKIDKQDGIVIVRNYCHCEESTGWYIGKGLMRCKDCNNPFDLDEIRQKAKDNEFVEYLNEKKE